MYRDSLYFGPRYLNRCQSIYYLDTWTLMPYKALMEPFKGTLFGYKSEQCILPRALLRPYFLVGLFGSTAVWVHGPLNFSPALPASTFLQDLGADRGGRSSTWPLRKSGTPLGNVYSRGLNNLNWTVGHTMQQL